MKIHVSHWRIYKFCMVLKQILHSFKIKLGLSCTFIIFYIIYVLFTTYLFGHFNIPFWLRLVGNEQGCRLVPRIIGETKIIYFFLFMGGKKKLN